MNTNLEPGQVWHYCDYFGRDLYTLIVRKDSIDSNTYSTICIGYFGTISNSGVVSLSGHTQITDSNTLKFIKMMFL